MYIPLLFFNSNGETDNFPISRGLYKSGENFCNSQLRKNGGGTFVLFLELPSPKEAGPITRALEKETLGFLIFSNYLAQGGTLTNGRKKHAC